MSKTLNDEEQIKVIVGLGNPSKEFLKTRHNVGYWFLEQLLDKFAVELKTDKKLNCDIGYFEFENDKIFLVKPLTFINDSGIVVRAVSDYYKINIESFLIVHDDIDVTVGTNKLKFKGGHGGHNGLRDIINHKNDSFWRLRIGVGHPGEKSLVHNYVLSAPTNSEKEIILNSFEDIHNNFALILKNKFEDFMNTLHRKKDGV